MTREREPWDDARAAYRQLGPNEAQLTRMLSNIARASLASPAAAGIKASKVAKILLCAATITGSSWLALEHAAPPYAPVTAKPTPASSVQTVAPVALVADSPPQESNAVDAISETPRPEPTRASAALREKRRGPSAHAPDPLAELAILQRARRVILRDPARTLALAEEHAASHPRGTFEEERELLAIDALLRLRRRSEAKLRAARFTRRHPQSVHAHRLDVMIDDAE